eukprot:TRINITY_DN13983_c0_g1_i1.p1 TRINITY_DN13983_c0_g1~~TRINITY_DN13983_c0_g1_i1.p1  ORF type:complete len:634 (+),score=33.18 TRINITY_DN13983_c0_g1_i1:107-2008(+)
MQRQKPGVPSVLIPDRLYFVLVSDVPQDTPDAHYFDTDQYLLYEPFFDDFGPLNAAHCKRFCDLVDDKLCSPQLQSSTIFYCSNYHDRRLSTNAACLAALYMVLRRGESATTAVAAVSNWAQCMIPFTDASPHVSCLDLHLSSVVYGVAKAALLGWYPVEKFDAAAYERSEQLAYGDWNWIVPGKFIAFSGPNGPHTTYTTADYVALFREIGVNHVLRLNSKTYDRGDFIRAGIQHSDLFFEDGSAPPHDVVSQFLALAAEPGTCIGVHCKAGLGRTGTLIAVWLMCEHGFTARETIGWIRFMRPGSVIGPQQRFLCSVEEEMLSRYRAGSNRVRERDCVAAFTPKGHSQRSPLEHAQPQAAPAISPLPPPAVREQSLSMTPPDRRVLSSNVFSHSPMGSCPVAGVSPEHQPVRVHSTTATAAVQQSLPTAVHAHSASAGPSTQSVQTAAHMYSASAAASAQSAQSAVRTHSAGATAPRSPVQARRATATVPVRTFDARAVPKQEPVSAARRPVAHKTISADCGRAFTTQITPPKWHAVPPGWRSMVGSQEPPASTSAWVAGATSPPSPQVGGPVSRVASDARPKTPWWSTMQPAATAARRAASPRSGPAPRRHSVGRAVTTRSRSACVARRR